VLQLLKPAPYAITVRNASDDPVNDVVLTISNPSVRDGHPRLEKIDAVQPGESVVIRHSRERPRINVSYSQGTEQFTSTHSLQWSQLLMEDDVADGDPVITIMENPPKDIVLTIHNNGRVKESFPAAVAEEN
jgi:hypothetical protein